MRFDLPNLRWETFKVLVRTHVVEFRGITKTNLMFCEFFFLFKELSWKIEGIIEWKFSTFITMWNLFTVQWDQIRINRT